MTFPELVSSQLRSNKPAIPAAKRRSDGVQVDELGEPVCQNAVLVAEYGKSNGFQDD